MFCCHFVFLVCFFAVPIVCPSFIFFVSVVSLTRLPFPSLDLTLIGIWDLDFELGLGFGLVNIQQEVKVHEKSYSHSSKYN